MTSTSDRKRKGLLFLTVFAFAFINCIEVKADESLIYVRTTLGKRYIHYNEVTSKYGDIWIGYTIAHDKIVTDSRAERFIIEKAYYYYKRDGNYVLLGLVDKTGVYDKDGTRLKGPPSRVASGYIIAGISSELVEGGSILGPQLILQSLTDSDSWREGESFVILDFDTQQDTLKLMDMSKFLAP